MNRQRTDQPLRDELRAATRGFGFAFGAWVMSIFALTRALTIGDALTAIAGGIITLTALTAMNASYLHCVELRRRLEVVERWRAL